ncbi:MAG: peptide-methionine (S)-S-oxide reductase [Bacteroidetes bacterium QS_8_68_28]|nr:MAG: peptide-methionine (S)-S-oxide reductase [Bacteroidetes bacterium QS_8_68_28]
MQTNGSPSSDDARAQATLAGGCFWCLEAAFQEVEGVEDVTSGYTGGYVEDPGYRAVCRDETGHAEAVQLTYDSGVIAYRNLLEIFFTIHDPTQLNRQGADVGTQYRSAIFYHDEAQREAAEETIERLEDGGVYSGIVTEVEPRETFYEAEPAHHDYYRRNPEAAYCRTVIDPKLAKLRQKHAARVGA